MGRTKLKPWRVRNSTVVVKDEWINLRADNCETSDGVTIDLYYVIEYPSWVTIVPITVDNHMVLVRQYRHGIGKVLLELPCGTFEETETYSIEAAERGLLEETGYTGSSFREIAKFSPNSSNHSNFSHVVLAEAVQKTSLQNLDYGEDIEIVLMPIDKVKSELQNGAFIQAMHIAAMYYGFLEIGKN